MLSGFGGLAHSHHGSVAAVRSPLWVFFLCPILMLLLARQVHAALTRDLVQFR